MDGVLTDFERHVEQKSGMRINQWSKLPVKERWAILEVDKNFWSKMPWKPDGKTLWSYIRKHNPHILSAYVSQVTDPYCIPGKRDWIRKNLGISGSRINLVQRRMKKTFAIKRGTSQQNLLIDDFTSNTREFYQNGGLAIRHTSASSTISQLKKLGL